MMHAVDALHCIAQCIALSANIGNNAQGECSLFDIATKAVFAFQSDLLCLVSNYAHDLVLAALEQCYGDVSTHVARDASDE